MVTLLASDVVHQAGRSAVNPCAMLLYLHLSGLLCLLLAAEAGD